MQPDVRGKRVTIMGLGLLGRGIGDALYLAKRGARLTITDRKPAQALAAAVKKVRGTKAALVLGKHRLSDFENADIVLKAAGVPYDSPYIARARNKGVPVKMDDSWFATLCDAPIIGITGTRGKTTTTRLIDAIARLTKRRVHLSGNIPGVATLPLAATVRERDLVVLELASWQLQGWRDERISPHIAVITNLYRDHMDYYRGSMARYGKDKEAIFAYQAPDDYLVLNRDNPFTRACAKKARSQVVWFSQRDIPASWKLKIRGEHNRANAAAALAVGKILKVPLAKIRRIIESFPGVPGRLEHVRSVAGVSYYNDTTGTSVEAVEAALRSFDEPVVLLCGGHDKQLRYGQLLPLIKRGTRAVILFSGAASDRISALLSRGGYRGTVLWARSMAEAVAHARMVAERGDVVVLSPGAASFGMFTNEYDRGDQFVAAVKRIRP